MFVFYCCCSTPKFTFNFSGFVNPFGHGAGHLKFNKNKYPVKTKLSNPIKIEILSPVFCSR